MSLPSTINELLMGSAGGGYTISNSLRFRSSASAYLNRTPASASNRKTWTWSGWVKRGSLSTGIILDVTGATNNSSWFQFSFSGDSLYVVMGYTYNQYGTSAVFRDPSAWYHVILAFDTTQATFADRFKVYVNGVQQTIVLKYADIGGDMPQNQDTAVNSTYTQIMGRYNYGASNYFDGYLTEINFIDGQALTPSSFGETSTTTGVWIPKKYTGTYGTNGFYLNFSNGTSTTTLGYDASGNSNNWTTNNISLTAGSTYDWMIDSPVNSPGSSYGVGNYCVLMPFTICNAVSAGYGTSAASDGNLNYSSIGSTSNSWSSFALPLSGKYYAEMRFVSLNTGSTGVMAYDGNANRSVLFNQNGTIYNNNSLSQSLTSWSSGDTIGLAINMDSSTIQFYRNGSAVGNPESITVAYGQYFIFNRYNAYLQSNFGQRPFSYTPPSGFKSLCTFNLPTPTIKKGSQYFNATTYTGNGSTGRQITGVGFAPDLTWIKSRSAAYDGLIFDTIRGAGKSLTPRATSAETTNNGNGYIGAFGSDGYTLTQGSSSIVSVNETSTTYVGWSWKAGGTAVTNTAGSISSQVSANPTSGFSVVTYTGTGSAGTIGHGLGVAPSMVIYKSRSLAGENWPVYHVGISNPATNQLRLNDTTASEASTNWNSTNPTSSVFSVGSGNATNSNTNTYVAYCFAAIPGYSAFGSYTGNGSTDGPFVNCGFRPRYVLIKRTDAAVDWMCFDTSRNVYNVVTGQINPNTSAAEDNSYTWLDILSNGFKCRVGLLGTNASGGTYIYAAFAENPFQNALAR